MMPTRSTPEDRGYVYDYIGAHDAATYELENRIAERSPG
jgi:hypothetical protein